jgi:hypothetical protein
MGALAAEALSLIELSLVKSMHASEQRIPAMEVAGIWETKRSIGNLKKVAFFGIDETISSLRNIGSDVRFGSIETEFGFVGIWFRDEQSGPVGIIGADATESSADKRKE